MDDVNNEFWQNIESGSIREQQPGMSLSLIPLLKSRKRVGDEEMDVDDGERNLE